MANESPQDPPFEGGSKRVVEVPAEIPKKGTSVVQVVIVVLVLLTVVVGALWILVPLLS